MKIHEVGNSMAIQWELSLLLLQGAQVQSLIKELRSCMLHGESKKKKEKKKIRQIVHLRDAIFSTHLIIQ